MTSKRYRLAGRLAAALPGLVLWASGTVALADDTEILTGQIGEYAAPNILFIIDTSGSMGGQVLIDDSYDPSVTYTGPFTNPEELYYSLTDFGGGFNYPDQSFIDFGSFVTTNAFVCASADMPLAQSGFYIDRLIQFDTQDNLWGFLESDNADPAVSGSNRLTECFRDLGIHGIEEDDEEVYPINLTDGDIDDDDDDGPGRPYSSDPDDPDRFDWGGYQLSYAIFSSNYLNWIAESAANGTPVLSTRLGVVQDVTRNLIDRLTIVDDPRQAFNIGLMRFSANGQGGMVLQPVKNVAESRDDIVAAVDSMFPSNNTPLSETMFEAYQYLRGGPVEFGATSIPVTSVSSSTTLDGLDYVSPIEASCQRNYVVLLTDGLPTSDTDAATRIEEIIGRTCVGNCLDELAIHMDTTDLLPGVEDEQTVQTYTIGFFTDSTLLSNTATGTIQPAQDGDPPTTGYFLADNVTELEGAFDSIFTRIETDVATFTSPAASVNSLNRLQNRNILYFTMFEPSPQGEPRWDGNLKAYKVGRETNEDDLTILDANNVEAIADDGTFSETARSIWSQVNDGGVVTEGGFISRLGLTRQVFTDVAGADLSLPENRITENNSTITAEQLGIATPPGPDGPAQAEERRKALLRMASGLDEDGQPLRTIGDPLHTRPLILTYAGGSEELAIFMSTNDGYLHRIDPTPIDGDVTSDLEEWAYIPSELLPNLDIIERNPPTLPSLSQKLYGLDGPLTAFIEGDTNSIVDSGERVFIYSAMRRGGTSYYGLDLGPGGNQSPRLKFKITRGGAFSRLGQTWSAAEHARMKIGDTERDVLIFGGGYDPVHDDDGGYVASTMGSAIYIVDAKTGQQLWRASSEAGADLTLPDMVYPIPSDITVLDINRDGLADRMYVGDTGGQVWRIDNLDGELSGAVFAQLGSSASPANERRFHNAPSVARIITRTGSFLTISLGSGWRAHPLATDNDDRFYVLKDVNVFAPQVDGNDEPIYPAPLTEADLVEIDRNATVAPDSSQLTSSGGWYLPLENGEKNLSSAITADNRVFFTTYLPESQTLSCQPTAAIGSGRLYALDIFTGFPALVNASGEDPDLDPGPLFEELPAGGIPPEPQLVFVEPPCVENCDGDPDEQVFATVGGTCVNPGSEVRLQVGLSGLPTDICTAPVRTYWSEAEDDPEDL